MLRRTTISKILFFIGFDQVSDHWVYKNNLTADSIILDFGANKGTFSKDIVRQFQSKCYLFEPNLALHSHYTFKTAGTYPVALGKKNQISDFYISENDEASSLLPDIQKTWPTNKVSKIEVNTIETILSKLHLQNQQIEILKLDIEGSELDFLESITKETSQIFNQITVEFHDWLDNSLHQRTKDAIKKLVCHNFEAIYSNKSHRQSLEILFLNKNVKFSALQKILLFTYRRIKYMKY